MNPPLHFHYVITYVHNTLRAAAAATLFARMKREISSSFVVPIKFYLMMMTIRPLQQGMRFFPNGRQFLLWGVGCFPPSASLSLSGPALLRIDINELLKLQRSSRLDTHTGQIIYQLLYHYENILYFLRPKCFMIFEILNGKG